MYKGNLFVCFKSIRVASSSRLLIIERQMHNEASILRFWLECHLLGFVVNPFYISVLQSIVSRIALCVVDRIYILNMQTEMGNML